MENLKNIINQLKKEVINEISSLVKVNSVQGEKENNKPFGIGPYNALKHVEALANKLGFKTKNYDNYALEIEFGDGKEILGILCHVDVVPAGDNWDFDPFGGIIHDGKIYGRGTLDDKGPLIINLYAMKYLMDNYQLNKKVRMIVGANEESGSLCLDYYFNHLKNEQPTLAYTPDSNFPVTFAEKGIIRIEFSAKFKTLDKYEIIGGNAYNSVADNATFTSNDIIITKKGKSAHAAKPELGINAIYLLFEELNKHNFENAELKGIINFFNQFIKNDIHGEHLNIYCKDEESGEITTNIGFIKLLKNELTMGMDIRVPVTFHINDIINKIKSIVPNWLNINVNYKEEPLYVKQDSFLVKKLMDIYKQTTGDIESKPIAIGGGTYARFCKNGVAFGALLRDQVDNMHQKNECLEISKIDILLEIYIKAIYELAK